MRIASGELDDHNQVERTAPILTFAANTYSEDDLYEVDRLERARRGVETASVVVSVAMLL